MDKIAAFHEILQLDPDNAFARYGLAMEHISQNKTDQGLAEFTTLIELNPDYVPAYQMSAQTLAKLSRTEEALERSTPGIAAPTAPATSTLSPRWKAYAKSSPLRQVD